MTKIDIPPKPNPSIFDPAVRELTPAPTVGSCLDRLAHLPGCLLLESSMPIQSATGRPLGRYSFLMADPFDTIVEPVGTRTPFSRLEKLLSQFDISPVKDLPPMQGGIAGLFSYDLNQSLERIQSTKSDDVHIPAIVLGAYDSVIAWDHLENRAWIISQGLPESDPEARSHRAASRLEFFASLLNSDPRHAQTQSAEPFTRSGLDQSITFEVDGPEGLVSNFSRDSYIAAVQKCIDYIYQGDVFQINLAQSLTFPANCDSIELYRRLRQCNPAPFSAYFDLSQISDCNSQIISASPERFFSVRDGIIETRPIKGTRRRTGQPMVDIHAKEELLASIKDRAENTMIVDLMRNDLSRVCDDDSITVTQLCELEEYPSVLHLVSAVQGRLKVDCQLTDVLAALFPGGSITGAPKIRAMEIIADLEPTARGAYCGSLGYLGFDGSADLNILIRTITASAGWLQIPVGGGIVSQSNPQSEYEETWTKASGLLRAATMNNLDRPPE